MTVAHPLARHWSRTNRIALESSANTPLPRPRISRTTKDRSAPRLIMNSSGEKLTARRFISAFITSSSIDLPGVNSDKGLAQDRCDPANSSTVGAGQGCEGRHVREGKLLRVPVFRNHRRLWAARLSVDSAPADCNRKARRAVRPVTELTAAIRCRVYCCGTRSTGVYNAASTTRSSHALTGRAKPVRICSRRDDSSRGHVCVRLSPS